MVLSNQLENNMESIKTIRVSGFVADASRAAAAARKSALLLDQAKPFTTAYGRLQDLKPKVRTFVEDSARLCQPDALHICDGSERELRHLLNVMQQAGMIEPLPKYTNCWLARTDPGDVARVE